MNILIIEDEPIAANKIKDILKSVMPKARLAPVLDTIDESVAYLKDNTPDLIFLDIELADGSSFEIFKAIEISSPIIFTTAYNQYAIQAFEVNSVDYLLKPITAESVSKALANLQRMRASFSYQEIRQSINELRDIGEAKKYKTSFLVKSGESLIPITQDSIAYFFASNKWVYLVTKNGKEHLINYSLGEVEALLDPIVFFRIARNYLVKKDAIVKLTPYYKGQVTVEIDPKNKEQIVVSRARTGDLKQWLSGE
jgi:two-component system, LytTR family, response regulator